MLKKKFFLLLSCLLTNNFFTAKTNSLELINPQENMEDAKNYFSYLKGTINYMDGNFDEALLEFEKLKKREDSVYFYDRFIRFLFLTNQFERIAKLEKKIKDSFKDNIEIQKIFAQSYFYLGKGAKADFFLEKLTKQYPNDIQLSYFKTVTLIKLGKLDKALDYIQKCLNKPELKSKHFLFYFLASKIHMQKNNTTQALKSIQSSLKLYADFEKGWLLKALLCEQLGKIEEAISGYQRFLNIVGKDEEVEKQLVRLLTMGKKYNEAEQRLKQIKNKTPFQILELALIEWKTNKKESALKQVEELIKNFPNFKQALFLKIEMLISSGKKLQALKLIEDNLLKNPKDTQTLKVLLLLRKTKIQISHIINILHRIEKKHPTKALYLALIDMYFEKLEYKKVLFYCKKLFKLTKDPGLKSKLLFQTAYIHFAAGDKEKVEKTLLAALKYKPVYPSVHNLIAYFYAQKNKNLKEALEHANLALINSPKCYYYLDTKGYILFKMGKIKESIELFKLALQFNPKDKEVAKHLNLALSFGK